MSGDANRISNGIAAVDDFFDGVFAPLRRWIPELEEQLRGAGGPMSGAVLVDLVRDGAHGILDTSDRPLYGAGFCGSDTVVTEGNPLAWWQGPERLLLASSTFGHGQAAIDLERLEWYRVPRQTGTQHVAGPFVDYLCSNEITLTSSVPLIVDGELWGVACADVLVATIEESLLPSMSGIEGAALVNAHGRVVVSSDPDRETGDRLPGVRPGSEDPGIALLRSERYPFALAAPNGVAASA